MFHGRRWQVTLSAIEVCISNAERLLMDASKTSPPTAAALAELSIEEACKAWLLYLRLTFQGRRPKTNLRFKRKAELQLGQYIEANDEYLRDLDKEIAGAFKRHGFKLRFLQFLFGYLKIAVPAAKESKQLHRVPELLHRGLFDVKEAEMVPQMENVEQLLSMFRPENFERLVDLKERGFYVNLTNSGDLVSPEVESHPVVALEELAGLLIGTLKGELILLTR